MDRCKRLNPFLSGVLLLTFCSLIIGSEPPTNNSTVEPAKTELDNLRDAVIKLTQQIKDLQTILAKSEKEIERLTNLCRQNGIQTEPAIEQTNKHPDKYMYRGRAYSEDWFEDADRKLWDKIACVDEKFVDISNVREVNLAIPSQIGQIRKWASNSVYRILRIIKPGEALISRPEITETMWNPDHTPKRIRIIAPEILFHVTGLPPDCRENSTVPEQGSNRDSHKARQSIRFGYLVYRGPYSYATLDGKRKTVASYDVYLPITREQFAQALDQNFDITPAVRKFEQERKINRR